MGHPADAAIASAAHYPRQRDHLLHNHRDCRLVAEWLQSEGLKVKPYYADVETDKSEDRAELERQLMHNEVKALVSSVALGMGFDKSDLHFVIHYQLPGSIISYYQQIGRRVAASTKPILC